MARNSYGSNSKRAKSVTGRPNKADLWPGAQFEVTQTDPGGNLNRTNPQKAPGHTATTLPASVQLASNQQSGANAPRRPTPAVGSDANNLPAKAIPLTRDTLDAALPEDSVYRTPSE